MSHDQQVTDKTTLDIFVRFTNIFPYTILILFYFRHEIYIFISSKYHRNILINQYSFPINVNNIQ